MQMIHRKVRFIFLSFYNFRICIVCIVLLFHVLWALLPEINVHLFIHTKHLNSCSNLANVNQAEILKKVVRTVNE